MLLVNGNVSCQRLLASAGDEVTLDQMALAAGAGTVSGVKPTAHEGQDSVSPAGESDCVSATGSASAFGPNL